MANIDFIYQNERQKEISFPLGGIGSGCVGLSGDGRLIDWELHNRPNKQSVNGFTHFATPIMALFLMRRTGVWGFAQ